MVRANRRHSLEIMGVFGKLLRRLGKVGGEKKGC
jgi:hypothetical protein